MRTALGGILVAGLLAAPVYAQSAGGPGDLPDRFQIDTGYFLIGADTTLRFNGPPGLGDINFEKDLGLEQDASTFWVDASWRPLRRHQLKMNFTKLDRERLDHTLTRTFEWAGQTYNAGLSTSATTGADILGGYYRFAVILNKRVEAGPTAGAGYLWLRAGIKATGSVAVPGGGVQSRTLDESASTGSITGALGGYATVWPASRVAVRADYLYIKVSPGDEEASVTDWRIGGDYYVFRHAGVGVQYKYNAYNYDRGILVSKIGGQVKFSGVQVFLSLLF